MSSPPQEQDGTSAASNDASHRRQSKRRPPPVPKKIVRGGVKGLHKRFKLTFPSIPTDPSKANKRGKYIDFDAAMKAVNDLRDRHEISVDFDYRADISSRLPSSVAPYRSATQQQQPDAGWRFFYDEEEYRTTGRPKLIMVQEDEQGSVMLDRGFAEMPKLAVFGRGTKAEDLPYPMTPVSNDVGSTRGMPLWEQPPPPEDEPAKMGKKVPGLRKEGRGGARDKIIECFEVKVVDEDVGKVYSPLRRWNEYKTTGDSGAFNSRLCAYYAVKKNLLPDQSASLKVLIEAARDHSDIATIKNECKAKKEKFSWFSVCTQLYDTCTTN